MQSTMVTQAILSAFCQFCKKYALKMTGTNLCVAAAGVSKNITFILDSFRSSSN